MKSMAHLTLASALVTAVAGCSLFADKNTIGGIDDDSQEEIVSGGLDFANMEHAQVRNEYQELLELVDDQFMKEQIQRRIAGVYMQESDKNASKLSAAPRQGYYRDAIQSYVDILEKYPNSPDNAEVLYQLAKAYDMEGQTLNALRMLERLADRHPYFTNISEAYFRMGDIYFNQKRYGKAENAYRQTTKMDGGKLTLNSHYMLGWSLYKQGKYHKALDSFAFVLNELLQAERSGQTLSNTERPLIDDTLHSITLALVNNGGAEGIEDVDQLDGQFYLWRVYQNLGNYYLEKQRYTDSALTFKRFVQEYESSARSPEFYKFLIQAYFKGGFPQEVLKAKEGYVATYGLGTDYWIEKGPEVQDKLKSDLNVYLTELAKYHHGKGQAHLKEQRQFLKAKKIKDAESEGEKAAAYYEKAIAYYDEFIRTFPLDKTTAKMHYMKAEAHFESGEYDESASSYELVAYQYKDDELKNKAAYAAIVSYQKQVQSLEEDSATYHVWQEKAVGSMLRFAEVFNEDDRSPAVLTNAAEYLFGLNQYDKAIKIAKNLLRSRGDLSTNLQETAYGIIAHSYFQLGNYQLAENNYLNQRQLVENGSQNYLNISQRIAASIFKKAEILRKNNQLSLAVVQLLRIKTEAPQSDVKVLAQYDAATLLIKLKRWNKALAEFKDLKNQHANHELAAEFPRKIAFIYEQTKRWKDAANAYYALYENDPDAQVQQEALFIASGLFRKIKDYKASITHYRDYAHKYEQPFDSRMEARFNLAELYEITKEKSKHLFWLRRIIDGDKKGGEQRTDRSRWLGAWANAKYGDYFAWEFDRKKLRQPLEVTLPKKNKSLQDATTRYEMAAAYGILEFVAMSSYKIADMYERFSSDLRKSPRPKGLNAADSQLYETIIEEQAGPFMELATNIHQSNIDRSWEGYFNEWIEKSYGAMKRLQPERFNKSETVARYGDEIR